MILKEILPLPRTPLPRNPVYRASESDSNPLSLFVATSLAPVRSLLVGGVAVLPTCRASCNHHSTPHQIWGYTKGDMPHSGKTDMGGCQNYGPLLGPMNTRCRIILRTQKGTRILTTTHIDRNNPSLVPASSLSHLDAQLT